MCTLQTRCVLYCNVSSLVMDIIMVSLLTRLNNAGMTSLKTWLINTGFSYYLCLLSEQLRKNRKIRFGNQISGLCVQFETRTVSYELLLLARSLVTGNRCHKSLEHHPVPLHLLHRGLTGAQAKTLLIIPTEMEFSVKLSRAVLDLSNNFLSITHFWYCFQVLNSQCHVTNSLK